MTVDEPELFGPNDGNFYEASRVGKTGEDRLAMYGSRSGQVVVFVGSLD